MTQDIPVKQQHKAHIRSGPGELTAETASGAAGPVDRDTHPLFSSGPRAIMISYSTVPCPRPTRRAPALRSSPATATLPASARAVKRRIPS